MRANISKSSRHTVDCTTLFHFHGATCVPSPLLATLSRNRTPIRPPSCRTRHPRSFLPLLLPILLVLASAVAVMAFPGLSGRRVPVSAGPASPRAPLPSRWGTIALSSTYETGENRGGNVPWTAWDVSVPWNVGGESGNDGGGRDGIGRGGGGGGGDGGGDESLEGMSPWWWSTLAYTVGECAERLRRLDAAAAGRDLLSWYLSLLVERPVVTKALSAGLVAILGDFLAQNVEGSIPGTEEQRTSSFATRHRRTLVVFLEAVLVVGPTMHIMFGAFDSVLPIVGTTGLTRTLSVMAHVLADTFFLDAFFIAIMFFSSSVAEGEDLRTVVPRMRQDYFDTLKATWILSGAMAPLEMCIFRYLPLSLRTVALNFTDIIWTSFTNFITYYKLHNSKTQNLTHLLS